MGETLTPAPRIRGSQMRRESPWAPTHRWWFPGATKLVAARLYRGAQVPKPSPSTTTFAPGASPW